jgi:phage gp29-like protein
MSEIDELKNKISGACIDWLANVCDSWAFNHLGIPDSQERVNILATLQLEYNQIVRQDSDCDCDAEIDKIVATATDELIGQVLDQVGDQVLGQVWGQFQ